MPFTHPLEDLGKLRRPFAADVVGLMVPFEESVDAQWPKTTLWEMLLLN